MPLFTVPQEQVQSEAGLGLPHSEQNLPVFVAPQEQVQLVLSGFGLPHSAQNLPVLPEWPQEQVQPPAAGWAGAAGA